MSQPAEYYIKDLNITADPDIENVSEGWAEIGIEWDDPTLNEERELVHAPCTIDLELMEEDWFMDSDSSRQDHRFGEVSIEAVVRLEGDLPTLEREVETWRTEGFRHTSSDFIGRIESEIVPNLFGPIDDLLRNAFLGIMPRVRFTRPPEEEER